MKPNFLAIVAVAGLILTGGCTTRFIDDFEADAAGSAPLTMPAGIPDDQLFILHGNAIRVTSSGPLSGAKSLNIGGPGTTEPTAPTLFMYAEPLGNPMQRVFASWAGQLTSGAAARIFFWTGHFSSMVEIVLQDGQIRVAGDTVGTYTPGGRHTILINADPATDQYQVSAFGAVSSGISATGPVANPGFFPQENIGLTMQLIGGGSGDGYKIDDVRMSERNPPETS